MWLALPVEMWALILRYLLRSQTLRDWRHILAVARTCHLLRDVMLDEIKVACPLVPFTRCAFVRRLDLMPVPPQFAFSVTAQGSLVVNQNRGLRGVELGYYEATEVSFSIRRPTQACIEHCQALGALVRPHTQSPTVYTVRVATSHAEDVWGVLWAADPRSATMDKWHWRVPVLQVLLVNYACLMVTVNGQDEQQIFLRVRRPMFDQVRTALQDCTGTATVEVKPFRTAYTMTPLERFLALAVGSYFELFPSIFGAPKGRRGKFVYLPCNRGSERAYHGIRRVQRTPPSLCHLSWLPAARCGPPACKILPDWCVCVNLVV